MIEGTVGLDHSYSKGINKTTIISKVIVAMLFYNSGIGFLFVAVCTNTATAPLGSVPSSRALKGLFAHATA